MSYVLYIYFKLCIYILLDDFELILLEVFPHLTSFSCLFVVIDHQTLVWRSIRCFLLSQQLFYRTVPGTNGAHPAHSLIRLVHGGWEDLLPHLHLHDGPAQRRHGGLDVQGFSLKGQVTAVGLQPFEPVLLLVVVHVLVQVLVALFALREDSNREPVLVHVVVVRHGEHDGQLLFSVVTVSPKEVIGQDSHCTWGLATTLGEVAHFGLQGAHSGLWWGVAVAVLQENPEEV